jgi:iron(III) transport system permease protein
VPVVSVALSLATPRAEVWSHLWLTQLPELVANTLALVAGVGAGAVVLGTALAWLVAAYRFPGHRVFEWALVLPLALPAYVMGFVLLGFFEFAGPLQTFLRAVAGPDVRLPALSPLGGVTLTMTLVFYPYVYVLARATFREQAAGLLDAARSLGRSGPGAFMAVALPIARPAIAAGGALAMMEALADLGTVSLFGHRTLSEAVYRTWAGMFDRLAATQLASVLLLGAFALLTLERRTRGRRRFWSRPRAERALVPIRLTGLAAAAATATCTTVLGLAFVLPVSQLVVWAARRDPTATGSASFVTLVTGTAWLAGTAAIVITAFGLVVAYARRLERTRATSLLTQFAAMGYAVPGVVIAVGVLVPIASVDRAVAALFHAAGWRMDILLTGSVLAILFAYLVRFLAVSLQGLDAALGRIPRTLDEAARSLGVAGVGLLRRVHVPLLRTDVAVTLLLVWIETMKELPATLLLRPIGLKTLAIEIWELTSESLWQEAALPALTLVLVGLVPLLLVTRLTRAPVP